MIVSATISWMNKTRIGDETKRIGECFESFGQTLVSRTLLQLRPLLRDAGAKTFAQLALSGSTIWSLRFLVKCLLALIYQINFIVLWTTLFLCTKWMRFVSHESSELKPGPDPMKSFQHCVATLRRNQVSRVSFKRLLRWLEFQHWVTKAR